VIAKLQHLSILVKQSTLLFSRIFILMVIFVLVIRTNSTAPVMKIKHRINYEYPGGIPQPDKKLKIRCKSSKESYYVISFLDPDLLRFSDAPDDYRSIDWRDMYHFDVNWLDKLKFKLLGSPLVSREN
jgi:hypothetical protein